MGQQPLRGSTHSSVQRTTQLADLNEVVEVPSLQARVLPVVGEGEQLSCRVGQIRLCPKTPHHARADHRRGRTAALCRKRRQLAEVAAPQLLVRDPAPKTEGEGT